MYTSELYCAQCLCFAALFIAGIYHNYFTVSVASIVVTWLWTRTLATDTVKSLLAYSNNKYLHHITKKGILSYNISQYFEQTEMQQLSYYNKKIV